MPRPAPLDPDAALAPPDPASFKAGLRLLRPMMLYHRYKVVGLEHIPRTGGCLLVVSHSLATYDGFFIGAAIFDATGRMCRGLGDDRIFQTPWIGEKARAVGITPASPGAGLRLLEAGELVGVAPGGMWESVRPRTERYGVRWGDRRGFCRLALQAQVPILLAGCPAANRIFDVYPSRLTDGVYQRFHLPLPIARGVGLSMWPRPTRLIHYLAPLIQPPPLDPDRETEQAEALFQAAKAGMEELLSRR